jgi:hypothetical protein
VRQVCAPVAGVHLLLLAGCLQLCGHLVLWCCAVVLGFAVWLQLAGWGVVYWAWLGGLVRRVVVRGVCVCARARAFVAAQVLCAMLCYCAGEKLCRWCAGYAGASGSAVGA